MTPVIGLPRLFRQHEYPGLWEDFFRSLGVRVVFSRATDKIIFDTGIKMCTGDICLPIKVLHGHVWSLRDQTDAVFIPRFIYPAPKESSCPKFCALPDILRHNLAESSLCEMTVDWNRGLPYTLSTLTPLAAFLSLPVPDVRAAFIRAMARSDEEPKVCAIPSAAAAPAKPAIGLVGHPYLTEDRFLTMNLRAKIEKQGYDVLTGHSLAYDLKRKNCSPFQDRAFWSIGVDILGTALTLMNDEHIKGLIYVTSFACGIDSIALELLDRSVQKKPSPPHMRLCLDEHTGESGLDTRLEAFLDLLERNPHSSITRSHQNIPV